MDPRATPSAILTSTSLDSPTNLASIALQTPLEPLHWQLAKAHGITVWVKREDLLHPAIQGNKFYKLYYSLQSARKAGISRVLSFGGAYSNHLHALAAAGELWGFATVGLIRGDDGQSLNPTLTDCQRMGMKLVFLSRTDYRRRSDPEFCQALVEMHGGGLLIAEGGAGPMAIKGCAEITKSIYASAPFAVDYIAAACGTGSTLAGLITGAKYSTHIIGVSVLKGVASGLTADIKAWLPDSHGLLPEWSLLNQYHCGGYAKMPDYLQTFCQDFEQETGLLLDPIYTSKLFFALYKEIEAGGFAPGSTIVVIHSGGLQGRRGYSWPLQPSGW